MHETNRLRLYSAMLFAERVRHGPTSVLIAQGKAAAKEKLAPIQKEFSSTDKADSSRWPDPCRPELLFLNFWNSRHDFSNGGRTARLQTGDSRL